MPDVRLFRTRCRRQLRYDLPFNAAEDLGPWRRRPSRARFVLVASRRSTDADTANDLVTYLEGNSAGQNGHVGRVRERLRRERWKFRKRGQQLACHIRVEDRPQCDDRVSLSKAALPGMDRGVVASWYDPGSAGYIHNVRRHVVTVRFATVYRLRCRRHRHVQGRLRPLKVTCACAAANDKIEAAPASSAEKVVRIDSLISL